MPVKDGLTETKRYGDGASATGPAPLPDRSPEQQAYKRPWWRHLFCWARQCRSGVYEDADGCAGQCVRCGKIVGHVTRDEIRAFMEREVANGR